MNRQSNQVTALYCRVDSGGCPDHAHKEILFQQKILMQYAKSHGLQNALIFSDCGFSGTDVNRPQFQRMLQAIKAGNVSALVVKDLSRLSRSYCDTAMLLEKVLPQYGVAFYSLDALSLSISPLYQTLCEKGGRA